MIRLQAFLLRAVATAAGAAVGLGILRHDRTLVLRVWVLVLGGLALLALVQAASDLAPDRARRPARRGGGRRERPDELRRLEDQVALASATAGDLYFHLRPVLREIAAERLAASGRELDPAAAGAAWDVLRPDLEPPLDPFARGLPPARLSEIVEALEAL